jgi:hypothetical protein
VIAIFAADYITVFVKIPGLEMAHISTYFYKYWYTVAGMVTGSVKCSYAKGNQDVRRKRKRISSKKVDFIRLNLRIKR